MRISVKCAQGMDPISPIVRMRTLDPYWRTIKGIPCNMLILSLHTHMPPIRTLGWHSSASPPPTPALLCRPRSCK